MDRITNMAFPITEKTDTIPTILAYQNNYYQRALLCTQSMPLFNFTYGQPQNNGWNFYQNNNWGGSLFGFDTNSGQQSFYNNNLWYVNQFNKFFQTTGYANNNIAVNGASASTPISTAGKSSTTQTITTSTTSPKNKPSSKELSSSIAKNAEKYIGYGEANGTFRRFSNSPEWCADFVTYVVKEAYRNKGLNPPAGFGSWRCENLKQWAINHNKFLTTANRSNKQDLIKARVKPGDIVIMRENGASHTGIVRYVDKETGNYQTIEGNVTTANRNDDKVLVMNHSYDDPEVSGFIQLA